MNSFVLKIIDYTNKLIIRDFYGITLYSLLEIIPFDTLLELIFSYDDIVKMLNDYDCFEQYINFLYQIKNDKSEKIIASLSDVDIEAARIPRKNNNQISENEMKIIFKALENNLELYEKLYKDKIYKIETTINRTVLLNIGQAKLFHLLGFDLLSWQRNYRQDIIRVMPELRGILSEDYVKMCQNNDIKLYKALETILKREQDILSAILSGDNISKAIPLQKVKTKNFAFERLGLLEAPAGMIFYNKTKDPLGNRNKIKSDIFLLRDFLQSLDLKWIFNGYAHDIDVSFKTETFRTKNVETLLIEPDYSNKFANQNVAITSSIGSIDRDKFNFRVSSIHDGSFGGSELIETEKYFSDDKIKFMAQKVIDSFPNLDLQHLRELVANNSFKLGK